MTNMSDLRHFYTDFDGSRQCKMKRIMQMNILPNLLHIFTDFDGFDKARSINLYFIKILLKVTKLNFFKLKSLEL